MASRTSTCWALLAMVGLTMSQNIPVFPSNTSSYNPNANANDSVVMVTTQLNNPVPLLALTDPALDELTNKILSTTSPGTELVDITVNSSHLTSDEFVYVSCDPSAWPGMITFNNTVNSAIQANVSAIIFYSLNANFCILNGSLPQSYDNVYSTVNTGNASSLMQHLTGMFGSTQAQAMLLTEAQYNNAVAASNANGSGIGGSSPSTAVAMIILYSITGIITALFLLIIITGAIRAHRHPERYGPRNIMGRPRQGRAKGIARAMLDTIPIVKFSGRDADKAEDVELQNNAQPPVEESDSSEQAQQAEPEIKPESSTQHAEKKEEDADGPTPAIQELPEEDKNGDNSLGCSICTEDFEEGQDLRVLPCNHRFHPACVDPWLLDVSGTCPLCRVDLRPTPTTEAATEGNEGENALPPPLDPPGANNNNRRRTIRNFFDRRRLNASTREERIAAIRDYRQEQRARESTDGETPQEAEQTENEGRWRRVRRSLRLGQNITVTNGEATTSTSETQ